MLISAVKLDFLTLTHLGGLWWTLVELQHLVFSSVGCCGQSERAAVWPQLSVCRGFPSHIQECHTVSGDTLSASPPRPSPSLFVGFPACLSAVFGRPACSLSLSLILVPPLSLPPHGMRVFVRCCTHKDPV